MAWQLIYTSAPRLLEAGRSGFGTVARHRQISPLLVSAIERASQFARQPGLDAGRVIYCHRIVAVAGGRFHVLSCIRDAGADYTGRTNHIAHHLIAEQREVAALGAGGASPADVLLAMSWIGAWDDAPRFLDAADEIALANFPVHPVGAWDQTTVDARNAWLLAAGEASRGAYLVHRPGTDLRAFFAESLRLAPDRLWQIPFTTALQPSDETSDFRWIGVAVDSTLRAQAESSGRPVLDLTRPSTLPPPEVPANALTIGIPRPTAVSAGAVAIAPQPRGAVVARVSQPVRKTTPTPALPKRSNRRWVVAGAAGLLLIAGGLGVVLPRMAESRNTRARQEALRKKVADWRVFSPQTADSFLNVIPEKISSADQLLDEVGKAVATVKAANFDKMRDIKTGDEFKQMAAAFSIEAPADFTAFADGIHTLRSLHAEIEKARATLEQAGFEACRKQRDALEAFAKVRQDQSAFSKAIDELRTSLDRAEVDALLACLHPARSPAENLPPTVSSQWLKQRLDATKAPANPYAKGVADSARGLLDAWDFVEAAPTDRVSDALKDRLAKSRQAWPKWLVQKAEKKLDQARGSAPADVSAHVEPRKVSTTPIYFVLGRASLENFVVPELRAGLSFRLVPKPGATPVELTERNRDGALRRTKVGDKDFQVDLTTQRILVQPALNDVPEPFALIAHDGAGHDEAQLWIVGAGRDPVFPKHKSGLRRTGDRIEIEPDAVPIDGLPKSALWLRIPVEPPEQLPVSAWTVDLADVRRKVEDARKKWDAAVNAGADASKSAEAEFNALAEKIEKIIRIDDPVSKQERADLAPKDAPPRVRCGGYAMAVARAPKYPGFDDLFIAGKALRDLDAKASAAKVSETIRPIGSAIQKIRSQFKNDNERSQYSPRIDALDKMLRAIQPESAQIKAQREKSAADLKARLAEKPAILSDRVPPGVYELGTKVDGTDIVLMQFEVPGK